MHELKILMDIKSNDSVANFIISHLDKENGKIRKQWNKSLQPGIDNPSVFSIPTVHGECKFMVSANGNVQVDQLASDLDLTIITFGTIKTGAALHCHSIQFFGENIHNTRPLSAKTILLQASKNITNEDILFGKQFLDISQTEELINKPAANLMTDGKLTICCNIFKNQGMWVGKQGVLCSIGKYIVMKNDSLNWQFNRQAEGTSTNTPKVTQALSLHN